MLLKNKSILGKSILEYIKENLSNYEIITYDEFSEKLNDLATLDLEDEQVKIPTLDKSYNLILRINGMDFYDKYNSSFNKVGSFECIIVFDGKTIGIIRGNISKDNVISINMIYLLPEERGEGAGYAIYEYFLENGYIIKSDSEITDSTYHLYLKLVDENGYETLLFNDGRLGLKK